MENKGLRYNTRVQQGGFWGLGVVWGSLGQFGVILRPVQPVQPVQGKKGAGTEMNVKTRVTNGSRAKERPRCRKQIIKLGIAPFVQSDVWDGMTLRVPASVLYQRNADATGGLNDIYTLNDTMRKQFYRMVSEGYFGQFKIVAARKYRNADGVLVDTYSLDTLRHRESNHKWPYGQCDECTRGLRSAQELVID